jgi:hypothetical protein
MGFCDRCAKYRELRFLVSYATGTKIVVAVCKDCYPHINFRVVKQDWYDAA